MDWEQFAAAMAGLGYLVANATLDGRVVCQMIWNCDHPSCTNSAQLHQPLTDMKSAPELGFLFDLALEARNTARATCQH
jgi:hypothetical protein